MDMQTWSRNAELTKASLDRFTMYEEFLVTSRKIMLATVCTRNMGPRHYIIIKYNTSICIEKIY